MEFHLHKGTNISHWLSQSERRGKEREEWFTSRDVSRIADIGFDHVRIPVDEEHLWHADGSRDETGFRLLNRILDWCDDKGLKAVVDLHILRSHYFNSREQQPLFSNAEAEKRFLEIWAELSHELRQRPTELLGYELLNAPTARNPEDWNRISHRAFELLRNNEPDRVIVLESTDFSDLTTFEQLDIPVDQNLILSFHYYSPLPLTHYRASWWEGGFYRGPVQYPGVPVPEETLSEIKDTEADVLRKWNKYYDRNVIVEELDPALKARERSGSPLYCCEFGCIEYVSSDPRHQWYEDVLSVFDRFQIGWANWDYKGQFGIIDTSGRESEIVAPLMNH